MRRLALRALAVAVLASFLAVLVPPSRARLKAAPTLADALGLGVSRPLAPPASRAHVTLGGVEGDLYEPGWPARGIVMVPGATREGLADERVIRAASALARSGRSVFVPDLALYDEEFAESDLDAVATATRVLAQRTGHRVVLLGFSYGGGFSLLVAARPAVRRAVDLVAVFGAYFDLVGVVQAVTTSASVVDGRRIPWEPDPRAARRFRQVLLDVTPRARRHALRAALAGERAPETLPADTRALHALLANDDPARVPELVSRLPERLRGVLERSSPASVADRIDVPVLALHATNDPAVPFAEALRLVDAVPHARLLRLEHFRHVEPARLSPAALLRGAGDLWRTWRFLGQTLSAGEPFAPPSIRRATLPRPTRASYP